MLRCMCPNSSFLSLTIFYFNPWLHLKKGSAPLSMAHLTLRHRRRKNAREKIDLWEIRRVGFFWRIEEKKEDTSTAHLCTISAIGGGTVPA